MLRKCFATAIVAFAIIHIGISAADAHRRWGFKRGHVKEVLLELDLTNEQRIEIAELVFDLREEDATKDEISEAVLAKFDEFGVEVPEDLSGHRYWGFHPLFILGDLLTDEQREEIHETRHDLRKALKADGVSREEIHDAVRAAVKELLAEWGVIDGDDDDADAVADLAVVDAEVQAAPSVAPTPERRTTSWGAIKTQR